MLSICIKYASLAFDDFMVYVLFKMVICTHGYMYSSKCTEPYSYLTASLLFI